MVRLVAFQLYFFFIYPKKTLSVSKQGTLSYITLDVVSQACPFCLDGDGRRGVCALDVGVVVIAVVQLEKEKKKKRCNV